MSRELPSAGHDVVLRDEAAAHSYIAGVCFKHGPPRAIGLELEWFLTDRHHPARTPTAAELRACLGAHAPLSLFPDEPHHAAPVALARGGAVSVEPGGQLELSSAPATSVSALIEAVRADTAALDSVLAPIGLIRTAFPPRTPRARVLSTGRYEAMEQAFDRIGPYGRRMMCGSAALQLCLDLGPREQAAQRWRLAHDLGPILLAAFATSTPPEPGAPVCGRMDAWWRLDPPRTAPPDTLDPDDYVERVLHTPMLAQRRADGTWRVDGRRSPCDRLAAGDQLTTADLDLHLSTLFPPVRPQGYLELRWLDAQPGEQWIAPLLLVAALFASPQAVAATLPILAPASGRWAPATTIGLADPVLAGAAADLHEHADAALRELAAADPGLAVVLDHTRELLHRRLVDRRTPAMDRPADRTVEAAAS